MTESEPYSFETLREFDRERLHAGDRLELTYTSKATPSSTPTTARATVKSIEDGYDPIVIRLDMDDRESPFSLVLFPTDSNLHYVRKLGERSRTANTIDTRITTTVVHRAERD